MVQGNKGATRPHQHIDFDAWDKEQTAPPPLEFRFAGKDYSVTPKLSFVMTRKLEQLDNDVKAMEPGNLDNDTMANISIVNRCGEILGALMGEENWNQLLADGFDIPKMFHFLEMIGNADAEHKAVAGEEVEEETVEPDPDAAPGEGGGEEQGKVSRSPATTSSPTGPPLSSTSSAFAPLPPGSFGG